jgi:hypothetical protein
MLIPVQMAINILLGLHLLWAGIGMVQWMKSEGIGPGGALIAGIAFSGTPKLIGHIALGHLGLVSAVAWTPWLLLVTRRIVVSGFNRGTRALHWYCLGGAVAAVLFLADLRWILPASVLAVLYGLRLLWREGGKIPTFLRSKGKEILAGLGIFLGIISGLAIPLSEFTVHSTRGNLSFQEISEISLPFDGILGIFIPSYGGWPEVLTFLGLLVVGLAFVAMIGKGKEWGFWSMITLVFLFLSLGNHTPLYKILFRILPVVSYLRVPARFFFICSFSISVLAGIGFELIWSGNLGHRIIKRVRLGIVGFGGLILLMSIGALVISSQDLETNVHPWYHMVFLAIILLSLGLFTLRRTIRGRVGVVLWSIAIILELSFFNQSILEVRSMEGVSLSRKVVNEISESGTGLMRIFSPSFSIPQHVAAIEQFQLADGVNPLQLSVYWSYMGDAIGFDKEEYSVTLPPYPEGEVDQIAYSNLNSQALGSLNVATVVSDFPLSSTGLTEVSRIEGIVIYQNINFRPRAYVVGPGDTDDAWRDVESIEWSPNRISIKAEGPGKLILSEVVYPGWRAKINGEDVALSSHEGLFRSVELLEDENLVEFQFQPWTVKVGAWITLITIILLAVIWWRR